MQPVIDLGAAGRGRRTVLVAVGAVTPWLSDSHYEPFDTIMDDGGLWYRNDYVPDWETAY